MGTETNRDFASLLDDLFVASELGDIAPAPTIPFDYLAVADELHSGRIRVAGETVAAEYREAGAALEDEFVSLLDHVKSEARVVEEPEPPSVDPEVIAAELGLSEAKPSDLAKMRRIFALANHPDRVAPHLRQRAMVRMQLANMMIDDAKRRAAKSKS